MTRVALWQQLVTYPAQTDRLLMEGIWPTPGIVAGLGVTVGAGRVVNIAPGKAVVAYGGGGGSALCVSDAVETATFGAAPGSGSSRIDLLLVQVNDSAVDSGGQNGFSFSIWQGAPAANPVPPAVPARAVVVAYVTSVGGQANLAQGNIAPGPSALARPYALGAPTSVPLVANVATTCPMNAATLQQNGGFTVVNLGLAVPLPGIYRVDGSISCNNLPSAILAAVYRNGAPAVIGNAGVNANWPGAGPVGRVSGLVRCAVGDVLTLVAQQIDAVTQTSMTDPTVNYLHVAYHSPA